MTRIHGILLVVAMCSSAHAGGFYKWKDENGKVHISDYMPDGVEVISGDRGMSLNKVSGPNIPVASGREGGHASGEV